MYLAVNISRNALFLDIMAQSISIAIQVDINQKLRQLNLSLQFNL